MRTLRYLSGWWVCCAFLIGHGILPAAAQAGDGESVLAKTATAVMPPEGEPGEALRVEGVVYLADGETPAAGVTVFAYHTDRNGRYSETDARRDQSRIKGTVTTDAHGRFRLETIRPGSYPGTTVPAHIHFEVTPPGGSRQDATLHFKDDPHLSASFKKRDAARGRFASIRPLESDAGGRWRCAFFIRLNK